MYIYIYILTQTITDKSGKKTRLIHPQYRNIQYTGCFHVSYIV